MEDFINVIQRDPQVQIKRKDILGKYIKLSYKYESKIRSDTLSQNVTFTEIINLMSIIIVDIDIELKLKIS